jgi:hypothetical protein
MSDDHTVNHVGNAGQVFQMGDNYGDLTLDSAGLHGAGHDGGTAVDLDEVIHELNRRAGAASGERREGLWEAIQVIKDARTAARRAR